ncbi:hypothetical protein LH51_04020 [Nitrincola sp. A-D6]|uniref:autotransporter domain-containing protein n=1 Tax=Nitrincola sp. A-D6 TaxID=1545442 RepID=UPI00051FC2DB|nr:autotransporter domain-containing protein [Nitrincola sp. A-D6]KGK42900.1 hypothetical protein LH51_04020 [Nitrincola sp. A-D6]
MMKWNLYSLLICLPLSSMLMAADTGIEGSISQTLGYDDNFLFEEDAQSTLSYVLTPTLTGYYRTQTYTSSLTGSVAIKRYSDFSRYNSQDPRLSWQQAWIRERALLSLNIGYTETEQREDAEEDLGDFSTRNTVKTYTFAPAYNYQLTQRDSIGLTFGYTERQYSEATSSDNQSYSLGGNWAHDLSERTILRANLSYTNYEAQGLATETNSDIWRASLGATYNWSERTSITALLGANWQDLEERNVLLNQSTQSTNSGSLASVQWTHKSLQSTYNASYSRDLSPSSDGAVREQDRLTLGWRYELSDLSSFSLNGSWLKSTDDTQTREFASISPSYNRQLSQSLTWGARYDFKYQTRTNEPSAESNQIQMNLVYKF